MLSSPNARRSRTAAVRREGVLAPDGLARVGFRAGRDHHVDVVAEGAGEHVGHGHVAVRHLIEAVNDQQQRALGRDPPGRLRPQLAEQGPELDHTRRGAAGQVQEAEQLGVHRLQEGDRRVPRPIRPEEATHQGRAAGELPGEGPVDQLADQHRLAEPARRLDQQVPTSGLREELVDARELKLAADIALPEKAQKACDIAEVVGPGIAHAVIQRNPNIAPGLEVTDLQRGQGRWGCAGPT
jgi:hypothetical protein